MRWCLMIIFTFALVGCQWLKPVSTSAVKHNSAATVAPASATQQANAHIALALVMVEHHDYAGAKSELFAAEKLAPDLARVHYSFGYYYEQTGMPKKAKAAYQKALALAPNNPYVQNSYGVFLCRNGKPRQAIRYFLSAVRYPSFDDMGLAYQNAGLCAQKAKDQALARYYFNKAKKYGL